MLRTHTLGTVHPLLLLPFFFLSSIYLFLPFSGPVLCPVPSRPDSFIFLCCCNLLKCNVVLLYHCHSRLLDFDKSLLMVSNIKLSDEIPFSSPFPHFVAYIFHAPSPHTHPHPLTAATPQCPMLVQSSCPSHLLLCLGKCRGLRL